MTDKEFKRLSRPQLLDIIYQLQLKQEELKNENEKLTQALDDKRLRIGKVGNIAEAALEIHNVLQTAQNAAEHYMAELQSRGNSEYERVMRLAEEEAEGIIAEARKRASEIVAEANRQASEILAKVETDKMRHESAVDYILREYSHKE